ncbi:MAG: thiamine phosphate synthase [Verrucomicrobiota bacterium]|nr:thiamine phosphate synthase [Verrucomicrobiota bacterium]
MKLVVISPEGEDPRETAVLGALFAAGLECYHVRKPGWSEEKLRTWLRALPADWRPRLVLHEHHDLVSELGLGGRHWRDDGAEWRGVPYPGITSRSCHDLPTLRTALGRYASVFFGPVLPSISKPGRAPRADLSFDEVSKLLAARAPLPRRTAVLALGGVTAEKIPQLHAIGFDGVAVLGAVWQSVDPVADFDQLQHAIFSHAA